jgi:hypothetical protein
MTVVSTEKETHGDGERGKKQETESDARMRRKGRRAYSEEGGGVAYNDDDDYGCERDNDDDARLLLLAASHASSSSPPSPSSSSSTSSSPSSSSPAVCAMALVVGYMLKQRLVPLLVDALQEQKRFVCVTVRQHRLF